MLCATATLVVVAAATPGSTADTEPPILSTVDLATALAGVPSPDGALHDQLVFYENRLAERPGDPVSAQGLARVRMLRFRAYNDTRELEALVRVLDTEGRAENTDEIATSISIGLARHDFTTALAAARRRSDVAPRGDEAAVLDLFDALWASGRHAEARSTLEGATFRTTSVAQLAREARLLDGLGLIDAATARMKRVVQLVDAYAESPVVRAWARVEYATFLSHSGHPEKSLAPLREALNLIEAYPAALEALGWLAYGVDGDIDAAEALFTASLDHGDHLDLLLELRDIALLRGNSHRAMELRERFLAEATRDEETARLYWRPLAQLLAEDDGTLTRALDYAEHDLAQRTDRGALTTHAWILHRMGRDAEARGAVEEALAWGQPEPAVLGVAGEILLADGARWRGRRLLREALQGRAELGPRKARHYETLLRGSAYHRLLLERFATG